MKYIKGLKNRDLVKKIIILIEEVQMETIMEGGRLIWALNGRLERQHKPEKNYNMGNLLWADRLYAPEKDYFVFYPGKNIKAVNEALRRQSYVEDDERIAAGEKEARYKEVGKVYRKGEDGQWQNPES